jgi:hypothetical protein
MNPRLVALIPGGIWKTRSIDEQPEMQMARWSIWEVGSGSSATRHLVGYNLIDHEGRVSSAIVEFDAVALRGRTKSGRIYELIGPPGQDGDGDYVLARWLHLNGEPEHREVTSEIVSLMSEANQ